MSQTSIIESEVESRVERLALGSESELTLVSIAETTQLLQKLESTEISGVLKSKEFLAFMDQVLDVLGIGTEITPESIQDAVDMMQDWIKVNILAKYPALIEPNVLRGAISGEAAKDIGNG